MSETADGACAQPGGGNSGSARADREGEGTAGRARAGQGGTGRADVSEFTRLLKEAARLQAEADAAYLRARDAKPDGVMWSQRYHDALIAAREREEANDDGE